MTQRGRGKGMTVIVKAEDAPRMLEELLLLCAHISDEGARTEIDATLCRAVAAIDHGEFFRSGT